MGRILPDFTEKLIAFLSILGMIGLGLRYLFAVIGAFTQGVGLGPLAPILAAAVALVAVAYVRVVLEFVMVPFQIYGNTWTIAGQGRLGGGAPVALGPAPFRAPTVAYTPGQQPIPSPL